MYCLLPPLVCVNVHSLVATLWAVLNQKLSDKGNEMSPALFGSVIAGISDFISVNKLSMGFWLIGVQSRLFHFLVDNILLFWVIGLGNLEREMGEKVLYFLQMIHSYSP